jgi:hypothetical protein
MEPKEKRWVAEQLAVGTDPAAIRELLKYGGVAPPPVEALASVASDACIDVCRELLEKSSKADALLELYDVLWRRSLASSSIPVLSRLDPETFLESFVCTNRTVVFRGLLKDSRMVTATSLAALRDRFGAVEVEFMTARDSDPDYDRHFGRSLERASLSAFLNRLSDYEGNDLYLVGRNDAFRLSPLNALLDDVALLENVLSKDWRSEALMWLGPAGTVTPLHYDRKNALFAQVMGTKQFKLIPSWQARYLYNSKGVYSDVDPSEPDLARHPEFAKANVLDVTLEPGDVLFLPAAWWHWVRALSPSLSVTFKVATPNPAGASTSHWQV